MGAYLNREAVNIPYTQTYDYQEESIAEGTAVEFRLIYQGKLPSESHADSRVIDNRIKVLFDGLRMPKASNEIDGAPQEGEDPFYCLLEDDSLITRVNVTTDRLLTPKADDERIHDVMLVIHVKTIVVDTDKAFLPYY